MPANYRDLTHITDDSRIDQDKVSEVHKLLSKWLREKMYGVDVREALARLAEQMSSDLYDDRQIAIALEKLAEKLQKQWDDEFQRINEEWKNTIGGVTVDSELINSRIYLHGIVYKTLKERLDDMQSKIEDLNPTEKVFTLTHNQREHVAIRVVTGVNGLGIVPLSAPLGGLDVKEIPATATYESLNTVTVLVPLKYKMSNPEITRVASNQYLLAEGNRTLIIYVGDKLEANVETTITQTFTMDFKGKMDGSLVENPNKSYRTPYSGVGSTDLINPNTLNNLLELDAGLYKKIADKDNIITTITINSGEYRSQMLFKYNIVEDIKRKFPSLFNGLALEQQAILARKYVVAANSSAFARGSNSDGNHCQINNFALGVWQGGDDYKNKTNEIKKISLPIIVSKHHILNDGTVNSLVSAKPSDGKTPSSLSIDYASLEYTVTIPFPPIN